MLKGNPTNEPFRLLSIDPGTNTLGIAIIDIDIVKKTKTLVYAYTFEAGRYLDAYQDHPQWENVEEKYWRLHRHEENLYGLLLHYRPHMVVHESAFMGKFPKAYQGLTECLCAIRQAISRYSLTLPILPITPMEVKWAIGGVKKEEVLKSVSELKDLQNLNLYLPYLDEHAVDSIAIGYTKANQLLASF